MTVGEMRIHSLCGPFNKLNLASTGTLCERRNEREVELVFQPAEASALGDIMLWPCMGFSGVEGPETMPALELFDEAVGVAGPESSSSPSSRFLCE